MTFVPIAVLWGCAPKAGPAGAPSQAACSVLIGDVSGLGLFADEEDEARRLAAPWFVGQGMRVADLDTASRVRARARKGRDPKTGDACGLPLPDRPAEERWWPTFGADAVVTVWVSCDDPDHCGLDVTIKDGPGIDRDILAEYHAPYDPGGPWRSSLAQALARLQPFHGQRAGGGVVGGVVGGALPVVVVRPEKLGVTARSASAADDLEPPAGTLRFTDDAAALRRCFDTPATGAELLVQADDDGRITRCQSRDADDAIARCTCDAVSSVGRMGRPLAGTRAWVSVTYRPADVVTPRNAVVEARLDAASEVAESGPDKGYWILVVSDHSIHDWEAPPDSTVASCFAAHTGLDTVKADATLTFDPHGTATDVDLRVAPRAMSDQERACVQAALMRSRAPCPDVVQATAEARLELRFTEILPVRYEHVPAAVRSHHVPSPPNAHS